MEMAGAAGAASNGAEAAGAIAPARDRSGGRTALLIVDMINDLDFVGSRTMRRDAVRIAATIADLRRLAAARDVPVVFINDNFGQWHSERTRLVEHARRPGSQGRAIVDQLEPDAEDFFVIKPQFSGFYATNLPVLLPKLGVRRLILTGLATDICVLFTAADAHMRDYDMWVPRDCVAGTNPERDRWALELMRQSMAAEVRPTSELTLDAWLGNPATQG
ncbi:cysteine hydrolase family protein [Sphingomonas profundi]|uniref:cysteine hydrolase family protein n=1 Tax=Alterirhizorhabdus profundi TaxID=2681549 RepID=UPI001E625D4C|nr:isochorismatase family cysteine hydrolase [Sphingomonas profundi]